VCQAPSPCEFPAHAVLATVRSWSVPYRGNIAEVVYEYMEFHNNPDLYARVLTIVQSSGMGKSRMIDELSKHHFVIPLNLRDGESGRFFWCLISKFIPLTKLTGYPASDSKVRSWFKTPGLSPAQSDLRCSAFLTALLEKTLEIVEDPQRQIRNAIEKSPNLREDEKEVALNHYPIALQEQFRLFMTVGQTFSKQGDLRVNFYDRVIERANEVGFRWYSSGPMLTAMYSYSMRPTRPENAKHQRASSVHKVS
jgi:hypothetical protein